MSSFLVFNKDYRLDILQSVMLVFLPALLTVAPLPSLWLAPPPLPCVYMYTVNTYTVCKGRGVWGYRRGGGLRQIKYQPQSPFTGKFLDEDILLWCLYIN